MNSTELALGAALQAIYASMTEEQQNEVRRCLYRDARKHEKPTDTEDAAMNILHTGQP